MKSSVGDCEGPAVGINPEGAADGANDTIAEGADDGFVGAEEGSPVGIKPDGPDVGD